MEMSPVEQLRRLLESPLDGRTARTYNHEVPDHLSRMYPNENYFVYERLDAEPDYDEEYEEYGDSEPHAGVDPTGEPPMGFAGYDYEEQAYCICERMISEFRQQIGPLGVQLADSIEALDITDNKHNIGMHGMLLYHMCAYLTYKKSQIGSKVHSKVFNISDLKEKFSDQKKATLKIEKFMKSLPKFTEIKNEIDRLHHKCKGENKDKGYDLKSESLLKFNEHVYEFFNIKIILECYYMYYKSLGGPDCKQLRKYVLPLMTRFYKTADSIDKNLVCDMNELVKKVVTLSTLRQLRRLGALVYEEREIIPNKYYSRYQAELKELKAVKNEFNSDQFYALH